MSNIPEKKESFLGKLLSKLKNTYVFQRTNIFNGSFFAMNNNLSFSFRIKVFLKKVIAVKITLAAVSHLLDLVKDIIILVEISHSQGRIVNLMSQTKPYIKSVCI